MALLVRISRRVFADDDAAMPRRDRASHGLQRLGDRRRSCAGPAPSPPGGCSPTPTRRLTASWLICMARLSDVAGERHRRRCRRSADLMRTAWAWPIAESLHFLGLCLLVGAIGTVRPAPAGRGAGAMPIAAVHRLIPWGLARVRDQRRHRAAVHADRARSVHLQPVVPPASCCSSTIGGLNASLFYVTLVPAGVRTRRPRSRRRAARRSSPLVSLVRVADDHRRAAG